MYGLIDVGALSNLMLREYPRSGSKAKHIIVIILLYLLVMPKYWGNTKFQLREFPPSGSKAISIERKKERAKVCANNGQSNTWTKIK